MFNKNYNNKESKLNFILILLGFIAGIISIIINLADPNISSYQDFLKKSSTTILILIIFILPTIISSISTFYKKSKNKNQP